MLPKVVLKILSESKKKSVLVIDDEQDIVLALRLLLEYYKYQVETFIDPEAALSNFRAGKYDLVLIDYKMPKMAGFELYEKLVGIDPLLKVCFISAFEISELPAFQEKHREIEPDCYMKKPVSPEIIAERIERVLNRPATWRRDNILV